MLKLQETNYFYPRSLVFNPSLPQHGEPDDRGRRFEVRVRDRKKRFPLPGADRDTHSLYPKTSCSNTRGCAKTSMKCSGRYIRGCLRKIANIPPEEGMPFFHLLSGLPAPYIPKSPFILRGRSKGRFGELCTSRVQLIFYSMAIWTPLHGNCFF